MILPGSFEKPWIQEIAKTIGKRGDPKLVGKNFHPDQFRLDQIDNSWALNINKLKWLTKLGRGWSRPPVFPHKDGTHNKYEHQNR